MSQNKYLDRVDLPCNDAGMTDHRNHDHPNTKGARAACRKAASSPADPFLADRPTFFDSPLYCDLCAEELLPSSRRISDLRHMPCPCGRRHPDGVAMGARRIAY